MQEAPIFDLDAGVECLAFVNTLDDRLGEQPRELVKTFADLVAFGVQTGSLTDREAVNLVESATTQHQAAEKALARALAVRETLYRIFSAVAGGRAVAAQDLAALNRELSSALARLRVHADEDSFTWVWDTRADLNRPLWPIVRSAGDLLTEDGGRVRECAAHDCGWLFLDESRNRSRRWCNMQTCGNRAKVDRFRARQRGMEAVE